MRQPTTVDDIRSALEQQDRELTVCSTKVHSVIKKMETLKIVLRNVDPPGVWSDIAQRECIDELEKVLYMLRDKAAEWED